MHPSLFGMTVIVSALWEICCAGDDVRAELLGFGFGVGGDPDAPVGLDMEGEWARAPRPYDFEHKGFVPPTRP